MRFSIISLNSYLEHIEASENNKTIRHESLQQMHSLHPSHYWKESWAILSTIRL